MGQERKRQKDMISKNSRSVEEIKQRKKDKGKGRS